MPEHKKPILIENQALNLAAELLTIDSGRDVSSEELESRLFFINRTISDYNKMLLEKKEFENDYLLANDLVLNALMNGIILFDNGLIRFLLNKPLPKLSYEVIIQKKERLDILKERLFTLLKDEDYKNLVEQLRIFLIEKARIVLLQKDIIPSSKNNIIDNIKKEDRQLYDDYMSLNEKNVKEIFQKNV